MPVAKMSINSFDISTVTPVKATNSKAFAEFLLDLYAKGTPFMVVPKTPASTALDNRQLQNAVAPAESSGWIEPKKINLRDSDNIAQIVQTSGTEGTPKLVALSGGNLNDVVRRLNGEMQLNDTVREYIGVPIYHSFGWGRVRCCAAAGGTCFIPANGFNLLEIVELLRSSQINAISAVPTLWRMLLGSSHLFDGISHKLRWIEIGSQYMHADEKKNLRELFRNATIVQHYGLTEASRSTFLNITRSETRDLESVGSPVGKVQVEIANSGCIRIKGPHVAAGYLVEGKLQSLCDPNGWLDTKDLGEIRNGMLYYVGRRDDQINCSGVKIQPDSIERKLWQSFNLTSGIYVSRIPDPLRGDGVLLSISQEVVVTDDAIRTEVARILADSGIRIGSMLKTQRLEVIPRTETGKVRRNELAAAFQNAPLAEVRSTVLNTGQPTGAADYSEFLIRCWTQATGAEAIDKDKNFYEHGGDSLNSISLAINLKKHKVPSEVISGALAGRSLGDLIRLVNHPSATHEPTFADGINAFRGLLVLNLILIHFLPGIIERLQPSPTPLLSKSLDFFYRFGTPSFAFMFGLSLGYFKFRQNAFSLGKEYIQSARSFIFLAIGIALIATIKLTNFYLGEETNGVPLVSHLFYSVLIYYLLAIMSVPIWIRLLQLSATPVRTAVMFAAVCVCVDICIKWSLSSAITENGILDLFRLTFAAKYSYFWMTAVVMLGCSTGLKIRSMRFVDAINLLSVYGICGLLFGAAAIINFEDASIQGRYGLKIELLATYAGIAMLLLAATALVTSRISLQGSLQKNVIRTLCAIGILSLPMYVGHSLIIPVKEMLVAFSIPDSASIAVSLLSFGALAAIGLRRAWV